MEDVKMSDVFPEAFQVEHNNSFEVQDATWYSYGSKYESDGDQDSAIEHAVLNHDRLVEENAELREGFKELKSIAMQEREWRLEDSEVGLGEAQESLDGLSYRIDQLLNK